jgi:hypothetical protein
MAKGMKRGEFNISSYALLPESPDRLAEADSDWMESWEPSTNSKPIEDRSRAVDMVRIEVQAAAVRVTLLLGD